MDSISLRQFFPIIKRLIKGKNYELKKQALINLDLAKKALENLHLEKDKALSLMNVRSYLEIAMENYKKGIYTWDIWDKDKVLWDQYTQYNKICVLLSCVHYTLGNSEISRKILLENMSNRGAWEFSLADIPNVIEITPRKLESSSKLFYSYLLGDSFSTFEKDIMEKADNLEESRHRDELDDDRDLTRIHLDY